MGRDDRILQEARALWRELFRDPPPLTVDGPTLLDLITERMPEAAYERIRSPHLRPANIAMPKRAGI